MIEFHLNDKAVSLSHIDPNTTLLQFLRTQAKLTGTKEGCASGDCGACTVLVANLRDEKPTYRSRNACITFLGQMHHCHVLTIEGLTQSGHLHPVQTAMIEKHGSQCGFCTPGIVMSLTGLHLKNKTQSRHEAITALSGNLCRCTGYKAILEAAKHAGTHRADSLPTLPKQPASINTLQFTNDNLSYYQPIDESSLQQLLAAHPTATLVAGGTDLALTITQQYQQIDCLIDLSKIITLQQIEASDDAFIIGAGVHIEILRNQIQDAYPHFAKMLARFAANQVRHAGTIGGNLVNASPIGDIAPVLLALQATLILHTAHGEVPMPVADFFISYKKTKLKSGEYLKAIIIPKLKTNEDLRVYKVSKRFEDDISTVLLACWVHLNGKKIQDCRFAFGGMAAIPKRASTLESMLSQSTFSESNLASAVASLDTDFAPLSDVRASANYRMTVAKNLFTRWYYELIQPAVTTQIEGYLEQVNA